MRWMMGVQPRLSQPGNVDSNTLEFGGFVSGFAKQAGVQFGDKLLKVDGVPIGSRREAFRAFFRQTPGDPMVLTLSRGGGPPFDVSLEIPPAVKQNPSDAIIALFLNILTPLFCILLGGLVAWRLGGSPLAYAFVMLLLASGKLLQAEPYLRWSFEPWLTWPMTFLDTFLPVILPVAWMCFTLLFPDPHSPYKLLPGMVWVLGLPTFVFTVLISIRDACQAHIPGALRWLGFLDRVPGKVMFFFVVAMLLFGFANFVYKLLREKQPAMRRRLQWMLVGLALGLAPVALFILSQYLLQRDPNSYPTFVIVFCTLTPIFIPLTLAYAVLVDRVLDVGMFVRQGLLASKTVSMVRVLLSGLLIWYAFALAAEKQTTVWSRIGIAACFVSILVVRKGADWLREWVDRRYFREAVNSEHLLMELSQEVRRISDPKMLLSTVTERIANVLHIPTVLALVPEGAHFVSVPQSAVRVTIAASDPLVTRMRQHRQPVTIATHDELRKIGSEVLLPLAVNRELHGILSLGPKRSEEPYSGRDLQLLESVAHQTALGLEIGRLTAAVTEEVAHRERMGRELEIAREVQQRLFPKAAPKVPGLDLAGGCWPAQMIGGDYYDFITPPSGGISLAVGDVAGKGIPAALLMAALQASLRGLILTGIVDLSDLMNKLNRLIYDASPANRFATFFYGLYDPETRVLRYSSAGHNPALLYRAATQEVIWLRTRGVGLGLMRNSKYEQAEIAVRSGDCLVFYTDGITEARNVSGDEYGEDRLAEVVRGSAGLGADQILAAIVRSVMEFADEAPQHDDITAIVARVG